MLIQEKKRGRERKAEGKKDDGVKPPLQNMRKREAGN
jgi:hypothetical protein